MGKDILADDFVLAWGGVSGSTKLIRPRAIDTIAAMWNVPGVFSTPSTAIINPATTQPTEPKTRTIGNCFPGSVICLNATLFERAIVGIYASE